MNAPVSLEQQLRKMMEEGTFPVQLSFYSLCLLPIDVQRSATSVGYTQAALTRFNSVPLSGSVCAEAGRTGLVL